MVSRRLAKDHVDVVTYVDSSDGCAVSVSEAYFVLNVKPAFQGGDRWTQSQTDGDCAGNVAGDVLEQLEMS